MSITRDLIAPFVACCGIVLGLFAIGTQGITLVSVGLFALTPLGMCVAFSGHDEEP